jgi:predicted RNA-binding protein (TIGR00451 family)
LQTSEALQRIRKTAEYQFGRGVGEVFFPDSVTIGFSKKTGRIRHVFLGDKLLATLRPTDGMFSLTIHGAKRIAANSKPLHNWVRAKNDVVSFIAEGKSVFAKHVTDADVEIRPMEEVIVLDEKGRVLAVGRAVLTGREMKAFRRGVAVKVRRGVKEES